MPFQTYASNKIEINRSINFQAYVPALQSASGRTEPESKVRDADGHRRGGRLSLQISKSSMGRRGQSRSRDAETDVHSP